MTTILLSAVLLLGTLPLAFAQAPTNDLAAITILDRMAHNIGAMHACSFRLDAEQDALDTDAGTIVTRHNSHQVSLAGPDKMFVISTGDAGHRSYWYNGETLIYYSFDENNFARASAPPTIVEAVDRLHESYEIDFPAADFIYPAFVGDLIEQSQRIAYLGRVKIGGKDTFHIVARGTVQDVELWIADDAATLPVKYAIRDKDKGQVTKFEGTFADWQINPDLPSAMFDFTPPPGAREVRLLARDAMKSGGRP